MIVFVEGEFEKGNCTVTQGDEKQEGHAKRDEDGNITVTVEEFDAGSVTLVLHDENDGTYVGALNGEGIFAG